MNTQRQSGQVAINIDNIENKSNTLTKQKTANTPNSFIKFYSLLTTQLLTLVA